MLDRKYFGIYWGHDAFSIAECEKGKPFKVAHIPFDTKLNIDQSQDMPEGLRFTALLKKALLDKEITSKKVHLSLPTEDIIFRSFIIPWMHPEEVKSVVDFEVTKYIPIKLEDLSYTYHPTTFTDNKQKNIRILFAAVRKDVLQRYTGILEHAGLQTVHIEPSAVSLVRVLRKNKNISSHDSFAILEFGDTEEKIIIVEKCIVQFIRKFQIPLDQDNQDVQSTQLLNDIRVSFNFHYRQNTQRKIEKIIAISKTPIPGLSKILSEEFNIESTAIIVPDILGKGHPNSLDILPAYGIALRDKTTSSKNFELSAKDIWSQKKVKNPFIFIRHYKITAMIAMGCVLTILLTSFLFRQMTLEYKNRRKALESKLGIFASMPADDIQKLTSRITDKLKMYNGIHTKSKTAFYILQIPQVLPEGLWLKDLSISYKSKRARSGKPGISLTLNGYAYNPDINEEFRMINNLVPWFNKQKHFGNTFENIVISNSRQEIFGKYIVIAFTLTFS